MNLKKNYFKNLSQSPLRQNADDSFYNSVGGQNRRIMDENQAMRQAIIDEKEHVENVRKGVKTVSNKVLNNDEFLRTEKDTARGRTGDVKGGGLLDDNTFNWLENTKEAYSRPGCVSFSCAILGEAGARVPMNDFVDPITGAKGGIRIYEEKKDGGNGGWVFYKSGDKMPIVPWNQRFDKRAKDLGFELQAEGTLPAEGDIIRSNYDFKLTSDDGDDLSEGVSGTDHSVVATDSLEQGGMGVYNSGNIYDGLDKSNTHYLRNSGFANELGKDRVQRYVGSTDYLENKFEEWKNDSNNQLKPLDTSLLATGITPFTSTPPKVDIIARAKPNVLTKKQIKKLKRK